jgi:hypothetical protein
MLLFASYYDQIGLTLGEIWLLVLLVQWWWVLPSLAGAVSPRSPRGASALRSDQRRLTASRNPPVLQRGIG